MTPTIVFAAGWFVGSLVMGMAMHRVALRMVQRAVRHSFEVATSAVQAHHQAIDKAVADAFAARRKP